ncbi:MAG: 4-hydroxy-3-methylbut-2-enyl diphosphate reductase [uncultured Chloroflexi bacterium]|uniref:4-hydroxy-3-methylbut-2-enyl diphosphate reductase n=1 Tax=uncultured Chloroflexota bacterium TaxID=166587 RepID=A0A6J4JYK9_9CHLR|nr:MAG: 4-hydroxy-3-methylbut-2-enyl diphosphate reductase [uncultured Chloroflexota bacterium]
MEVVDAAERGLCWGVRRSLETVDRALHAAPGTLPVLGSLAHHPRLVEGLARRGAPVVQDHSEITGDRVVVTAHGLPPATLATLARRGLTVIDATCPIVRRAQQAVSSHAAHGRFVVIYGEPGHVEVQGLLGWAGPAAVATTSPIEAAAAVPVGADIGLVSQTTRESAAYHSFACELIDAFGPGRVTVLETVCGVTERQKLSARALAADVGVVVVVGGLASANTRHLGEVCTAEGAVVHRVETAEDLRPEWFRGVTRVGVTAGASTPDDVLDGVRAWLETH